MYELWIVIGKYVSLLLVSCQACFCSRLNLQDLWEFQFV
uniref:Uncharacterized protein n=1 Tax=Rhizophora mucronata TaxID=61149 RepID=A0A2P2MJL4_RHIMU